MHQNAAYAASKQLATHYPHLRVGMQSTNSYSSRWPGMHLIIKGQDYTTLAALVRTFPLLRPWYQEWTRQQQSTRKRKALDRAWTLQQLQRAADHEA